MGLMDKLITTIASHHVPMRKVLIWIFTLIGITSTVGVGALYYFVGVLPAIVLFIACTSVTGYWLFWYGHGVLGTPQCLKLPKLHSIPQQPGTLRFLVLSDTHNKHKKMTNLPEADVLLHCGDFTYRGTKREIASFNKWLGTLPYEHKIVIPGNHDIGLDVEGYDGLLAHWHKSKRSVVDPQAMVDSMTNCTLLINSSITIGGIKIWGSPHTPFINPERPMAFNRHRGQDIKQVWDKIPEDVDIIMTHGPPGGIGDRIMAGKRVGSVELTKAIRRIKPKFHCFGHIHEDYGIHYDSHNIDLQHVEKNNENKSGNENENENRNRNRNRNRNGDGDGNGDEKEDRKSDSKTNNNIFNNYNHDDGSPTDTIFVNAAVCTLVYTARHEPILIDVPTRQ